jgi:anti-sigma factor RsiW
MSSCTEVRTSLGVYVLGAIEPSERSVVDEHLSHCRRCRDELASMAGLPALLGRVTEEQIAQVSEPPEELLSSILAAAAGRKNAARRTQRVWLMLAAAAVLILIGGGTLLGATLRGSPASHPTPIAAGQIVSASDAATHVAGRADVWPEDWGTGMTFSLTGLRPGDQCQLIAIAKNGRRDVAASWQVAYDGYGKDPQFAGSTMIPRDQLASLEVRTLDGRTLLTLKI